MGFVQPEKVSLGGPAYKAEFVTALAE